MIPRAITNEACMDSSLQMDSLELKQQSASYYKDNTHQQ